MIKTLLFACISMMLAWTSAQSKRPAYVPADAVTEGEWLWRDGTRITYSDWADTNSIYHKQIDGYICEWK